MTLILDLDLDIVNMWLHGKNEVSCQSNQSQSVNNTDKTLLVLELS